MTEVNWLMAYQYFREYATEFLNVPKNKLPKPIAEEMITANLTFRGFSVTDIGSGITIGVTREDESFFLSVEGGRARLEQEGEMVKYLPIIKRIYDNSLDCLKQVAASSVA